MGRRWISVDSSLFIGGTGIPTRGPYGLARASQGHLAPASSPPGACSRTRRPTPPHGGGLVRSGARSRTRRPTPPHGGGLLVARASRPCVAGASCPCIFASWREIAHAAADPAALRRACSIRREIAHAAFVPPSGAGGFLPWATADVTSIRPRRAAAGLFDLAHALTGGVQVPGQCPGTACPAYRQAAGRQALPVARADIMRPGRYTVRP